MVDCLNKGKGKRKIIVSILYIIVWGAILFNMMKTTMVGYDVPRYMYLFRALSFIMVLLIILRRIKIYDVSTIILLIIALSALFAYRLRNSSGWGETYSSSQTWKYVFFILFFVVIADMIKSQNYVRSREMCICAIVFALTSVCIIAIAEIESVLEIFACGIAIYFTSISQEEWEEQIKYMSIAGYLSSVLLFAISFIQNPNGFIEGRYVGNFTFPVAAGITASFGLLCAIYYLITQVVLKKITWWHLIIVILAMLFPIAMLIIVMNRASLIGLILLAILSWVFFVGKPSRKKIIVRSVVTVVGLVAISFIGLCIMKVIADGKVDNMLNNNSDNVLLKPFEYVVGVSKYAFHAGTEFSMFEEGSMLNAVDNFSSSRITLWVLGLKTAKLLPLEDVGVIYPSGGYMPHVHNQFICMVRRYGYLGGIPLIVSHFYFLVISIKNNRKNKPRFLMTYLWMAYSTGLLLFEYKFWGMMPYCLMLILLYPVINKGEED